MTVTAFRAGLLAGLTLFLVGSGLMYLWLHNPVPEPPYNMEVSASGRDLTAHGAKALVIQTTYGPVVRQTCNGACDDIAYKADSTDNTFSVSVFDGTGACLVCEEGGEYVTQGARSVSRLVVRGEGKLITERHHLSQQPDGSLAVSKPPPPEIRP